MASVLSTALLDHKAAIRSNQLNYVPNRGIDDHDVSLIQFKGKVVLVNSWATWCGPCRIEIPWPIDLQNRFSARGFTVLGVAVDEKRKSAVARFVQRNDSRLAGHLNYPIVLGSDATADKFGGLVGFPTSVLISKDGRIVKTAVTVRDSNQVTGQRSNQLNYVPNRGINNLQ